jgi:hypothetical protein
MTTEPFLFHGHMVTREALQAAIEAVAKGLTRKDLPLTYSEIARLDARGGRK